MQPEQYVTVLVKRCTKAALWVILAVGPVACGDKSTGPSKRGQVVLDVRFAGAVAAKAVAVLRMDRMVATAHLEGKLVRQQELSYQAGTWRGTLKLPAGTYQIAVEAFKAERVRWRGSTSIELRGGRTVTAVVELTSTNRAPVLTGIGDQQVAEGNVLTLGLSASDADEDELTYSMSGYPSGASLNGSTFTWTPTDGQAGAYQVTFSVVDGQGGTDQDTITITVSAAPQGNRAPVFAVIGNRQATEGSALTIELAATDQDQDALTYQVENLPSGASLNGSTFTWTPTDGQAGAYQVTFTVADGQGGTDQATITITVSAATQENRAPVFAVIGNRQVAEGSVLTIELAATDQDQDALTYQVENLPSGASLRGSTFTWTPTDGQAGAYQVTFSVADGQGGSDQATITITVSAASTGTQENRAPVLESIGDRQVAEGSVLTIELAATDEDGDALTYWVSGQPVGSSLTGAIFTWTPTPEQGGIYQVTFTVEDGRGNSVSKTITITVIDINQPPVLEPIGDRTVDIGTSLTIELSATDIDGDELTYTMLGYPQGASLSDTTFTWTPEPRQLGSTYHIGFTVEDGRGGTTRETITVTVTERRFLYWVDSDAGKVQRAPTVAGSTIETLVTGLDDPRGIALDPDGGKVYWTCPFCSGGGVWRANFDGSLIENLGTVSGSDIALDVDQGKMYLADWTGTIFRAGLSGSPVETLATGLDGSEVIALDLSEGKMYWAGWRGDKIQRANLDGSQIETIVPGVERVYGLAVDEVKGKIYWGGWGGIRRANLDGSQIEDLFDVSGADAIALDVSRGMIYWADRYDGRIHRANLDGSQIEIVVSGLEEPTDIDLYP